MFLMASFAEDLAQPEYVHVLLNPLPVYGLLIAIVGLAIVLAFFRRSQAARITALVLVGISAISVWPVIEYGEAGYDRVQSMSDTDGEAWLKAHADRADWVAPVYYALAGLALIAILAPRKWPGSAVPLAVATLVLALGAIGGGAWVGYAGGRIRHSEFRNGPPPASSPDSDEDSH